MMHAPAARCAQSLLALILTALATSAGAIVVDFEDVGANLPIDGDDYYNGADGAGGFTSGGATFNNTFTDFGGGFIGWEGWAYSQTTDATTPGFGNQYSAFAGGGADGSATYGVGFPGGTGAPGITTITLGSEQTVAGGYFTNTTYAALSMRDGDGFSKKFGGASGDDPDWLLLSILGYDAAGTQTGSVDVYMADYRFADNNLDSILDEWLWVDLTGLGSAQSIGFVMSGTDVGDFGLNTPAYFALDGLVVIPEPATALLCATGLVVLGIRRRGRIG